MEKIRKLICLLGLAGAMLAVQAHAEIPGDLRYEAAPGGEAKLRPQWLQTLMQQEGFVELPGGSGKNPQHAFEWIDAVYMSPDLERAVFIKGGIQLKDRHLVGKLIHDTTTDFLYHLQGPQQDVTALYLVGFTPVLAHELTERAQNVSARTTQYFPALIPEAWADSCLPSDSAPRINADAHTITLNMRRREEFISWWKACGRGFSDSTVGSVKDVAKVVGQAAQFAQFAHTQPALAWHSAKFTWKKAKTAIAQFGDLIRKLWPQVKGMRATDIPPEVVAQLACSIGTDVIIGMMTGGAASAKIYLTLARYLQKLEKTPVIGKYATQLARQARIVAEGKISLKAAKAAGIPMSGSAAYERMLRDYLKNNPGADYHLLKDFFIKQRNDTSCSLASVTMVLNAMKKKGSTLTQDDVIRLSKNRFWQKAVSDTGNGMELDQLGAVLKDALPEIGLKGAKVEIVHVTDVSPAGLAKFRKELIANEKSAKDFIILNFDQQKYLNGVGPASGHYSPLGGFDRVTNRVLVVDPDAELNGSYFKSLEAVMEGMNTKDSGSGAVRGYIKITRP